MEYYVDINWEAGKFYKVACFVILYSDTKHSELTYFRGSDSGEGRGGGNAKKRKQEKKKNSGGMAAPFFTSLPSSSPLSEGATPMVTMTFVKGSVKKGSCDNVTQKMNSRCFKLHRTYSTSFNSTNVGKFFWSWTLTDCSEVQEKKKKVLVSCSPTLNKTWSFFKTSQSCDDGNEMYKKRDARVKLLFCWFTGLFT